MITTRAQVQAVLGVTRVAACSGAPVYKVGSYLGPPQISISAGLATYVVSVRLLHMLSPLMLMALTVAVRHPMLKLLILVSKTGIPSPLRKEEEVHLSVRIARSADQFIRVGHSLEGASEVLDGGLGPVLVEVGPLVVLEGAHELDEGGRAARLVALTLLFFIDVLCSYDLLEDAQSSPLGND